MSNNIIDGAKAGQMIGGQYDMILVAAQRAREVSAERRKEDWARKNDAISLAGAERKNYVRSLLLAARKNYGPSSQALFEIEQGHVGKEYLQKITER